MSRTHNSGIRHKRGAFAFRRMYAGYKLRRNSQLAATKTSY